MIRRLFILILISLIPFTSVNGQEIVKPVWEFPSKKYTVKDGLSHESINRVFTDSKDFVWIATKEGIDRFDGLKFTNYNTDTTFIKDFIDDIQEDKKGNIWFSGRRGVYKYDGLEFRFYPTKLNYSTPKILLMKEGVGFKTRGLGETSFYFYSYEKDTLFKENRFEEIITNDNISFINFFQLEDDKYLTHFRFKKDGEFTYFLFEIDGNKKRLISKNSIIFPIPSYPNPDSIFYFRDGNSIFRYLDDKYEKVREITFPENARLYLINGQLIISDRYTVNDFGDGSNAYQIYQSQFKSFGLFPSEKGFYRIASGELANIFYKNPFQFFPKEKGMLTSVWGTLEGNEGELLFSSFPDSKIISYKNNKYKTVFIGENNAKYRFYPAALKTHDGKFLFSAQTKLITIDEDNIKEKDSPLFNHLIEYNNRVYGVGKGLYEYKEGRLLNHFTDADGLVMDSLGFIETVEVDSNGLFWLGSHLGIATWDGKKFQNYYVKKDISSGISSIKKDHRNNLWFATHSGISFYNYTTLLPKLIESNKFHKPLKWIEMIDTSYILFGGTGELHLLDLPSFYKGDFHLYNLTEEDGFSGDDCMINGSFKDSKGNIWIGTPNGVIKLNPSKLKLHKAPTEPHFSIFLYQKKGSENEVVQRFKIGANNQQITAKSEDRNFEFSFFTINHHKPKSITYRHRLKGYEDTWSLPKTPRFVSYNNLPVGKYEFELQACLYGECSEIKSVFLEILPSKLVEYRWVKILFGGFIFSLISVAIFSYWNSVKKKRETEKMALKQLKVQKNLATHKIAPHFTFNILTALSNLVAKKEIDDSLTYIDKFSNLFRTLTKNEGVLLRPLGDEIQFIRDYLDLEKLRFNNLFHSEINIDSSVDLSINIPSMVIQSFVNNAIKHGMEYLEEGGLIQINVSQDDTILRVEVIDNGIGMEASKEASGKYQSGEGIKIVKDIFNFLNSNHPVPCEFKITNNLKKGTRVVIKIYTNYPKVI